MSRFTQRHFNVMSVALGSWLATEIIEYNVFAGEPLNQRRVDHRLCMVYKIVHGLVTIPIRLSQIVSHPV